MFTRRRVNPATLPRMPAGRRWFMRGFSVLLRIGFTWPRRLRRAGELLPRLSALAARFAGGGISLLHFPWGRPRLPLAVIPPCGARTFLMQGGCGQSAKHFDHNPLRTLLLSLLGRIDLFYHTPRGKTTVALALFQNFMNQNADRLSFLQRIKRKLFGKRHFLLCKLDESLLICNFTIAKLQISAYNKKVINIRYFQNENR